MKFGFSTLIILFSLSFYFPISADPISKKEADKWIQHVLHIRGLSPKADLVAIIKADEKIARANLMSMPTSFAFNRDLADIAHELGHFAEHEHNYPKARELHLEALELYKKAGVLEIHGSWDGELHSLEHIFMDFYDEGIVEEKKGHADKADKLFNDAYEWLEKHQLADTELIGSVERFTPRYMRLIHARRQQSKSLTEFHKRVLASSSCKKFLSDDK